MPSECLTGRRWAGVVAVAAAVLASLCVSAPAFAQPTLGGEWHMDALSVAGEGIWSTPDTSGNGLGVSGNVPPSALVPGRWGNAVGFNAADFYELSTTQPQPDLEPAHVAVMAWVKAAQSPGPNAYIIAQGGGPTCTPSSYALTTGGDGGLQFDVSDGASVSPSADPGPHVWDGNWHFVVGTYDGTTVRLYVDGSEVTPGTASNTVIGYQLPTDTFTVGGYPDPNCRQFAFYTGALDEVRVYDRALTADEISQLQQASTGDTPPELGGDDHDDDHGHHPDGARAVAPGREVRGRWAVGDPQAWHLVQRCDLDRRRRRADRQLRLGSHRDRQLLGPVRERPDRVADVRKPRHSHDRSTGDRQ